jgi:hypothetical protein
MFVLTAVCYFAREPLKFEREAALAKRTNVRTGVLAKQVFETLLQAFVR